MIYLISSTVASELKSISVRMLADKSRYSSKPVMLVGKFKNWPAPTTVTVRRCYGEQRSPANRGEHVPQKTHRDPLCSLDIWLIFNLLNVGRARSLSNESTCELAVRRYMDDSAKSHYIICRYCLLNNLNN